MPARREGPLAVARGSVPALVSAAILTLLLRAVYTAFAAIVVSSLRLDPALIRSNQMTDHLMQRSQGFAYVLLGVWERFDTLWYLHIAASGYDRPDAVVFYPLYPLLIRASSLVLRNPLLAALAVSTAATFFLFWGLQQLLRLDVSEPIAARAAILMAAWPGSFVLLAGYPDSLTIGLILWSVYSARTGRWWLAGASGFFAGMAKAVGTLVVVPLVVLAWRRRNLRAAWPVALSLLAPVMLQSYIRLLGYPDASAVYATYWNTAVAWPWTTLFASVRDALAGGGLLLDLNLGILILIYALALARPLAIEYALYALATLALFLAKKTDPLLQSTMRYVLAVFPAYAALAALLEGWVPCAVVAVLLFDFNLLLLFRFFDWSLIV